MELWAEIERSPGYWVSTDGRICSPSGRMIQGPHHGTGYRVVSLPDGDNWRRLFIHRLVLTTFMGPCPEGHQGAHWNGDRADNRLANLRWVTAAENAADRERHGNTPRIPNGSRPASAATISRRRIADTQAETAKPAPSLAPSHTSSRTAKPGKPTCAPTRKRTGTGCAPTGSYTSAPIVSAKRFNRQG